MNDPQLKLLKVFRPEVPFTVWGGHPYEIDVFQKLDANNPQDNYSVATKIAEEERTGSLKKILQFYDFEQTGERIGFHSDSTISRSGKFSILLDTIPEFSLAFQKDCKLFRKERKGILRASVYCYPVNLPDKSSLVLVSSLENNGKIYDYHASSLSDLKPKAGNWTELVLRYELPEIKSDADIFKVYLWQRGKPLVKLDDYTIELLVTK